MGYGQGEVGVPSLGTASPCARGQTAAPKGGQGGGVEKGALTAIRGCALPAAAQHIPRGVRGLVTTCLLARSC